MLFSSSTLHLKFQVLAIHQHLHLLYTNIPSSIRLAKFEPTLQQKKRLGTNGILRSSKAFATHFVNCMESARLYLCWNPSQIPQSPRASITSYAEWILVTLNKAVKLVKVTIKRSNLWFIWSIHPIHYTCCRWVKWVCHTNKAETKKMQDMSGYLGIWSAARLGNPAFGLGLAFSRGLFVPVPSSGRQIWSKWNWHGLMRLWVQKCCYQKGSPLLEDIRKSQSSQKLRSYCNDKFKLR